MECFKSDQEFLAEITNQKVMLMHFYEYFVKKYVLRDRTEPEKNRWCSHGESQSTLYDASSIISIKEPTAEMASPADL